MRTLGELKSGESAVVASFRDNMLASRLMSMGVIPGTQVQIVRKSLTGATYFLQFSQLALAVRKEEAALIVIE